MRSSKIDAALTPPEPFSALLFDCDGTLVDSVTAYENAWERAFAAQGRTMPPGWYRARTGLSPAALADAAALHDPTPLDKEAVQSQATRHFVELVELVISNERVTAVAHATMDRSRWPSSPGDRKPPCKPHSRRPASSACSMRL